VKLKGTNFNLKQKIYWLFYYYVKERKQYFELSGKYMLAVIELCFSKSFSKFLTSEMSIFLSNQFEGEA